MIAEPKLSSRPSITPAAEEDNATPDPLGSPIVKSVTSAVAEVLVLVIVIVPDVSKASVSAAAAVTVAKLLICQTNF